MTMRHHLDPARLLEGLNPEQRRAVEHGEGPLLVLAGAGSGKTRVITHRIAHLVATGVPASEIVAVTFTNKAAREMKERVAKLLGSERLPLFVGTFHSFALRLLRKYARLFDFTETFSVYDTGDQLALAKRVCAELELPDKAFPPKSLLGRVSEAKNALVGTSEFAQRNKDFYGVRLASFYSLYQKKLKAADAMDFDDLISNCVALFGAGVIDPSTGEPLSKTLHRQMRHFLVDEYQDTNHAQAELIRRLTAETKNVCAVGDDDQSIYRWRGALVGNILDFEQDFPGAVTVKLERNYRSSSRILDSATGVVNKNPRRHKKKLWTDRGEGERIRVFRARDEREESGWVADEIAALRAKGRKLSECAVLFRTNAQSRPFEDELRRRDWPYVLVGGVKFYERAEIKDALAYLRLALHPGDDGAFHRIVNVPARGIGASTIDKLRAAADAAEVSLWEAVARGLAPAGPPPAGSPNVVSFPAPSPQPAIRLDVSERARKALTDFRSTVEDVAATAQTKPAAPTLDYLLARTGYRALYEKSDDPQDEARLENLEELLRAAAEFDAAEPEGLAAGFLDAVSLTADVDAFDETKEKGVVLMTLHSAKGLEFPFVFLAGLEEGLLPHRSSMNDPEELEEERRLAYVGMTRAMERLSISWARLRNLYGQTNESLPSSFLEDLPKDHVELLGEDPDVRPAWARGADDDEERSQEPVGLWSGFGAKRNTFEPWKNRPPVKPIPFPSPARPVPLRPSENPPPPKVTGPKWKESAEIAKGMRVRHAQYGVGVVLLTEGTGDQKKLTVWFERAGRKKLIAKYAQLSPA
jgi:DNA helicase-2/ATP-dependent DNA helicase PcrA